MRGWAGSRPSNGVPIRDERGCGVEARWLRVEEVRRGVRWMYGFMRAWAVVMEVRVRGRVPTAGGGGSRGDSIG